jgi:hypothetical protein
LSSDNNDVQVLLRGNLSALFIIGNKEYMIYCMLSDGNLKLRDSKTGSGTRHVDVKKSDLICLITDPETGYEEFCLVDKDGTINSNTNAYSIPIRFVERIQKWVEMKQETLAKIKAGNMVLSNDLLDIKKIKISEEIKEQFDEDQ